MVIAEKYREVYDALVAQRGKDATLFAVLKMDEVIDKWSVLLAAEWITEETHKEVFSDLVGIIQHKLNTEEMSEIARIFLANSNTDHLVKLFLKEYKTGQKIKGDRQLNGKVIHEGYIVALNG